MATPRRTCGSASASEFGGDHPPDWRVQTTFVAALQDAAEAAVEKGLRRTGKPALQAALVAIDPATGNILALVGGRDYQRSAFNRASRSRRQPGSAFKPFVFAAALERGMSPVSTLTGLNQIAPQGPDEWTPRNVHDDAPDELTLRAALIESNNRLYGVLQAGRRHSGSSLHDPPRLDPPAPHADGPGLDGRSGPPGPRDLSLALTAAA